jgi:PAS domain S-box-containing protein
MTEVRPAPAPQIAGAIESPASEAEPRRSAAFFDNLIDSSPDGIIAADLEGKIVLFNAGARQILGYSEKEALALPVDALFPAGGTREVMRKLRGPDHGGPGKLLRQRVILRTRDGREVPVSLSASMVREDGRETATVGTFRDLRPIERMEKKLEEARAQLFGAEKLASLGKLAAGIAHEINNPLSGVLIYANLILEDMGAQSAHADDLRCIIQETTRCKAIVRDLLEFAHQQAFEMHPIDLGQVVETALRLLIKKAFFRNVHLFKELDPALPPVLGDAARLRQVVLNLVINAVEAMKGHGSLTITTRRRTGAPMAQLAVTDTGPGIPEEALPRVFDPFFTTKQVGEGTGLGLSVSYGIVRDHHGTIRVESKVGKGTTFLVDLPIADVPETE